MVCVYVRDPNACKLAYDLFELSSPKAAGELPKGALSAVQQHATPLEAVDVDGGDIAIFGGHGRSCAQKHYLQFFIPCLLAQTPLFHNPSHYA